MPELLVRELASSSYFIRLLGIRDDRHSRVSAYLGQCVDWSFIGYGHVIVHFDEADVAEVNDAGHNLPQRLKVYSQKRMSAP